MADLLPFERDALDGVAARARATEGADRRIVWDTLDAAGCAHADADELARHLLNGCGVTLNFHPDRYSNNGKLIITNLLEEGEYKSQFATGTTNGGRTAYPGGERDEWERGLFRGAYHDGGADSENRAPYGDFTKNLYLNGGADLKNRALQEDSARNPYLIGAETLGNRPKYGALNAMNYLDGASSRFGSCFFVLRPNAMDRCTFAFGDSSSGPDSLGTKAAFFPVLRALLVEVAGTGRFLNREGVDVSGAVAHILSMQRGTLEKTGIGRNLDDCIEAHVHGPVSMATDVYALYIDRSFEGTDIHAQSLALAERYGIRLGWIPARRLRVQDITEAFRGPAIPPLAARIAGELNGGADIIDAETIGRASRFLAENPGVWSDLGDELALFQYIKQLWHTVAYFGVCDSAPMR